MFCSGVLVGVSGCHDLAGNQALPSGTQDPGYYDNAIGALGMRNAAVFNFGNTLREFIAQTGLLADELTVIDKYQDRGVSTDLRLMPEQGSDPSVIYSTDAVYSKLQGARTALLLALGQLAASDTAVSDTLVLSPSANRALRGELHALYGFTEIYLADLFCSGIPLSTIDFHKDFTYHVASPRDSVYQDAIVHFDSALSLAGDSARFADLARVGLGRAYLNLGDATAAAQAVASVPDAYAYQRSVQFGNTDVNYLSNQINSVGTVGDREGGYGLPYISGGDVRTKTTTVTNANSARPFQFPSVYATVLSTGYASVSIASGTEARLIQAEVALRQGDVNGWLTLLNHLRATAHIPGAPVLPDSVLDTLGVTGCDLTHTCGPDGVSGGTFQVPTTNYTLASADTVHPAPTSGAPDGGSIADYCWNYSYYNPCAFGDTMVVNVYRFTAGPSPLEPLTDPGVTLSGSAADSARVALTFQERAAWLFMTGHRQGDLRRQLRQYPQYWPSQSTLYPSGPYLYSPIAGTQYGTDVTAPIPGSEYLNPLFHGCLDRAP
jgi:hypothetical protein